MKLYKFRPLANDNDYDRAKRIIETGEFYCSTFTEFNDPMEGVYRVQWGNLEKVKEIFDEKRKYKICSFSSVGAFTNPAMWGYYANGFKGIAIEIEVDEEDVNKIRYVKSPSDFETTEGDKVKTILTTKLESWEHEKEYRYLNNKSDGSFIKIGEITGVYFGAPYANTVNKEKIRKNSNGLCCYECIRKRLLSFARDKKVNCYSVKIDGNGNVESQNSGISQSINPNR